MIDRWRIGSSNDEQVLLEADVETDTNQLVAIYYRNATPQPASLTIILPSGQRIVHLLNADRTDTTINLPVGGRPSLAGVSIGFDWPAVPAGVPKI